MAATVDGPRRSRPATHGERPGYCERRENDRSASLRPPGPVTCHPPVCTLQRWASRLSPHSSEPPSPPVGVVLIALRGKLDTSRIRDPAHPSTSSRRGTTTGAQLKAATLPPPRSLVSSTSTTSARDRAKWTGCGAELPSRLHRAGLDSRKVGMSRGSRVCPAQ